jgi:Malectin domain
LQLGGTGWQNGVPYPRNVAESHGNLIGDIFVIFGGFHNDWSVASNATYTLDTSNASATWQKVDDIPIGAGLTHGAHIHIGSKIYNCGGYVGGHPGLHTSQCIVYDQSKPIGQRWSTMTPLPDGRGGGGMFYNMALNAMYYVTGAQRYKTPWLSTMDFNTTWMYSFNNPSAGWVRKADLPYASNHMMAVTAKDSNGVEHHYAFGGQYKENEVDGGYALVYEYDAMKDKWIRRADHPYTRAHGTGSTHGFGCGFITVAGNTNGVEITKISNVTYYDIETDTWTEIGHIPYELNTPICDINRNTNVMYCETGVLWTSRSYKRQLLLTPAPPTVPVASPVKAPVAPPSAAGPTFPILINSGGPQYIDPSNRTWMEDKYDLWGSRYCVNTTIGNTDNDELYLCERTGGYFYYSIPVPVGTYTVILHYAEI